MRSIDRMMGAIHGSGTVTPVVVPYLMYYFTETVDRITPFTREQLLKGDLSTRVEALSQLHAYFDCDWMRVTAFTPEGWKLYGTVGRKPGSVTEEVVPAEALLEMGLYDVAAELVRRFKDDKFIYGRVALPYGALFGDFSDIEGAFVAMRREPERCLRAIESSIPQLLEEVKAWAQVGVHGLWLGQWMCSADLISEAYYLRFVYPYDKIILDAVRDAGLVGIYHFCGHVIPRLKHIKNAAPVVFGVEEPKKGFEIPIGDVRAELGGDTCLLGNIDVYDVVEKGTPETWAQEVERQIRAAGPARFIVSCGSPVTDDTPPDQVRAFIQVARQVTQSFAPVERSQA